MEEHYSEKGKRDSREEAGRNEKDREKRRGREIGGK